MGVHILNGVVVVVVGWWWLRFTSCWIWSRNSAKQGLLFVVFLVLVQLAKLLLKLLVVVGGVVEALE